MLVDGSSCWSSDHSNTPVTQVVPQCSTPSQFCPYIMANGRSHTTNQTFNKK